MRQSGGAERLLVMQLSEDGRAMKRFLVPGIVSGLDRGKLLVELRDGEPIQLMREADFDEVESAVARAGGLVPRLKTGDGHAQRR